MEFVNNPCSIRHLNIFIVNETDRSDRFEYQKNDFSVNSLDFQRIDICDSIQIYSESCGMRFLNKNSCVDFFNRSWSFFGPAEFCLVLSVTLDRGSKYCFTWCTLITLTSLWSRWGLESTASWMFTQSNIRAHIKENINAPRHWPLCGEFPHKGPVTRKMFPFDDVIMLSHWE